MWCSLRGSSCGGVLGPNVHKVRQDRGDAVVRVGGAAGGGAVGVGKVGLRGYQGCDAAKDTLAGD
jgi:hypothetical protein